jgi:hypothetical protein
MERVVIFRNFPFLSRKELSLPAEEEAEWAPETV